MPYTPQKTSLNPSPHKKKDPNLDPLIQRLLLPLYRLAQTLGKRRDLLVMKLSERILETCFETSDALFKG